MSKNRRNFSRINFKAEALLVIENKRVKGKLADLSLHGLLIEIMEENALKVGDTCDIELIFSEEQKKHTVKAASVYINDDQYGFKFIEIDIDTITHIRRTIELYTGDPELVKEELFFLAPCAPKSSKSFL